MWYFEKEKDIWQQKSCNPYILIHKQFSVQFFLKNQSPLNEPNGDHFVDICFETAAAVLKVLKQWIAFINFLNTNSNVY